ncbi:hypothetical protein D8M05_00515 [Oceanobacillus bengalensis]|uniref:Uncharacterized protein n=1 Tax=Oceanobacillus bengalensis TaxID=1435466 RepID=A0A494Z7P9_9BACI|nr:hypothetical protein D8M05_00515 [Oceanobacillus bengalensis]
MYYLTSPGEWRAVTPAGIARVRRPRSGVFSARRAEAVPAESIRPERSPDGETCSDLRYSELN